MSAAPGLTDAEITALICDAVPNWNGQFMVTNLRVLAQHCYAAGQMSVSESYAQRQAHPQGQGEPVLWQLLDDRGEPTDWIRLTRPPVDDGDTWRALYAAPAAQGQVSASGLYAAIAHGDAKHRTWLREAVDAYFAGEPIPAQDAAPAASPPAGAVAEPDALVQQLRAMVEDESSLTAEEAWEVERAADRIEQLQASRAVWDADAQNYGRVLAERDKLQAQHEADAARIAELERIGNKLWTRAETAEAARDAAVALLREAVEYLVDAQMVGQVDAFLATQDAKASDGEACSVCGGTMFPGHKHP